MHGVTTEIRITRFVERVVEGNIGTEGGRGDGGMEETA